MDAAFGESSLNTTEPSGVMARSPSASTPLIRPSGTFSPAGRRGQCRPPASELTVAGSQSGRPRPTGERAGVRGSGRWRRARSLRFRPRCPRSRPHGPRPGAKKDHRSHGIAHENAGQTDKVVAAAVTWSYHHTPYSLNKASLHASMRPADGGPCSFGTPGKHINADRDNVPSVCRRARRDDCPIIQQAILSRPGRTTSTNGIGFR